MEGIFKLEMRKTFYIAIVILSVFLAGCGGTETNTTPANTNANSTVSNTANANSGTLTATTPTPAGKTNDAPTLTPVAEAYCAAKEKGDEAALRRVFDSDSLQDLEKQMDADGIDSLVEFLSLDRVTTANCELWNEKFIDDNQATAILRTESMPQGGEVLFVKEGGEWKMSTRLPEFSN